MKFWNANLCFLILVRCENFLWQILHSNGFSPEIKKNYFKHIKDDWFFILCKSPVWIRICFTLSQDWANCLLQNVHLWGFPDKCIRKCFTRSFSSAYGTWQTSQMCFPPICFLACFANEYDWRNVKAKGNKTVRYYINWQQNKFMIMEYQKK
jgi:hypothetical protein